MSGNKAENLARLLGTFIGATTGASGLAGAGFLTRSRFEDRFKDDKEKTFPEKLVSHAPTIGGLTGAILGGAYGYSRAGSAYKDLLKNINKVKKFNDLEEKVEQTREIINNLNKTSALKPNVRLKPHQERSIKQILDNDGSLLVAHATGSGKTITGIAAFEKLKEKGKAKKAIVVVPASLRTNFVENGIKKFTNSSVATYGPKNESRSLDIGKKSNKTYNVVSYDLFREHGDKILQDTGADTLIMDEIHRARGDEGRTYHSLVDIRPKFRNAITLTGSVVNNEPNEVVPLLDVTYGRTGHKLVSKKFFDKLFVDKQTSVKGLFNPKTVIDKKIKNKQQLAKYLAGKIDYVDHEELEKDLPKKKVDTIEVRMTPEQNKLYQYSLSTVDPLTRWKIRNNIPVGQREASEAFGKLTQGRQISTDHGFLDKYLKEKNPLDYSPKVQKVVSDLKEHLDQDKKHKSVIFGNLINNQVGSVEEALKKEKVPYTKFLGMGQKGMSSKNRDQNIKDFMKGNKRVLLISGAGSEGLDLKNVSMMQMLEGHFNPEKIQQAEARIRRLGSDTDSVTIKRYVTKPIPGVIDKFLGGGDKGIDQWIYTIAKKKEDLNNDFKDVLKKQADADLLLGDLGKRIDKTKEQAIDAATGYFGSGAGTLIGAPVGTIGDYFLKKRTEPKIEAGLKQHLLDKGEEGLTKKIHYPKILAESKIDERVLDAQAGVEGLSVALTMLPLASMVSPAAKKITEMMGTPALPVAKGLTHLLPKKYGDILRTAIERNPKMAKRLAGSVAMGITSAASLPVMKTLAKQIVLDSALQGGAVSRDLDIGIQRYKDKLRKKINRKYKSSKGFVNEYETKEELGIDQIS